MGTFKGIMPPGYRLCYLWKYTKIMNQGDPGVQSTILVMRDQKENMYLTILKMELCGTGTK